MTTDARQGTDPALLLGVGSKVVTSIPFPAQFELEDADRIWQKAQEPSKTPPTSGFRAMVRKPVRALMRACWRVGRPVLRPMVLRFRQFLLGGFYEDLVEEMQTALERSSSELNRRLDQRFEALERSVLRSVNQSEAGTRAEVREAITALKAELSDQASAKWAAKVHDRSPDLR